MKILNKKTRVYSSYIEKYELNGVYAGQKDIPIGTLILYIIAQQPDIKFVSMSAEADGEIGEERNIVNIELNQYQNIIANINRLTDIFIRMKLEIWELKCSYKDVELAIVGRTYGTILSIRYPINRSINLLPLFNFVENETWAYNEYDSILVHRMKKWFNMNQKVTIQMLMGLEKYPDLFEEFKQGMRGDKFQFHKSGQISVEGYTAERLHDEYPLSELGAYNYLIYLREDPKNALKDLKNGLPRK